MKNPWVKYAAKVGFQVVHLASSIVQESGVGLEGPTKQRHAMLHGRHGMCTPKHKCPFQSTEKTKPSRPHMGYLWVGENLQGTQTVGPYWIRRIEFSVVSSRIAHSCIPRGTGDLNRYPWNSTDVLSWDSVGNGQVWGENRSALVQTSSGGWVRWEDILFPILLRLLPNYILIISSNAWLCHELIVTRRHRPEFTHCGFGEVCHLVNALILVLINLDSWIRSGRHCKPL